MPCFDKFVLTQKNFYCFVLYQTIPTLLCRAGLSKCGVLFETLLRGPTQCFVEIFDGEHGVMIEIGDVTKRGLKG